MTKAKGPDTGDAALATAFPVNHALPMHLNLRKMVASEVSAEFGNFRALGNCCRMQEY